MSDHIEKLLHCSICGGLIKIKTDDTRPQYYHNSNDTVKCTKCNREISIQEHIESYRDVRQVIESPMSDIYKRIETLEKRVDDFINYHSTVRVRK